MLVLRPEFVTDWLSTKLPPVQHILHCSRVIWIYHGLDLANLSSTEFQIICSSLFSPRRMHHVAQNAFKKNHCLKHSVRLMPHFSGKKKKSQLKRKENHITTNTDIYSFVHPFIHQEFCHSLKLSSIHLLITSFMGVFTHLLTQSSLHIFVNLLLNEWVYSLI